MKGEDVTEERIRARRIELVDDEDNVRMILDGGQGGERGPQIDLYDEDGNERAYLALRANGSTILSFNDENGNRRAGMGINSDGTVQLLLSDASSIRAGMGIHHDGVARLGVFDGSGKMRASMAANPDNGAGLNLYDTQGRQRLTVGFYSIGASEKRTAEAKLAELGFDPAEVRLVEGEYANIGVRPRRHRRIRADSSNFREARNPYWATGHADRCPSP